VIEVDEFSSPEELKNKLIEFLSEVEYSELITVKDDVPHTRPMVYANDGVTIYMISKKNATKVNHIEKNPNVSVLIIKSFKESEKIKELTLEGKASILPTSEERDNAFRMFDKKSKNFQFWVGKSNDDYEVLRIEPHLMKYFDYSREDGKPLVLNLI